MRVLIQERVDIQNMQLNLHSPDAIADCKLVPLEEVVGCAGLRGPVLKQQGALCVCLPSLTLMRSPARE